MDSVQKHEVKLVPPDMVAKAAAAALGALALWALIMAISQVREYRYIGAGINPTNTITVSGEGELFAVPDVAEFTATISEDAKDVKTAQDAATKKTNDIIAFLRSQGIEERDIKTVDYNVSPKYEWLNAQESLCTGGYCRPGKQELTGYTVSQALQIKVRDTKKAGDLLAGVGGKGVSNVSGLTFTVADQNLLEEQARSKAIDKAKAKADVLAKQLGVNVVRVVGFNENNNYPVYARAATMDMAYGKGGAELQSAPAPELPQGTNKITSNVTVTYEIR